MPDYLEFPTDVASVRCSLTISRPGRVSGRSSDLGIRIASYNQPFNLNRGQAYWSGEFEIAPTDRGNEEHRGIIEAIIVSYLHGNKTIKIPVSRSSIVTFNQEPVGDMMTAANNKMTFTSSAITAINFKQGTYFTIDDKLYMFFAANKNVIAGPNDTNTRKLPILSGDTFPPYPTAQATGRIVEYKEPYLLGVLPQDSSVLLDREGSFAGPWVIPFVSE